MIYELKTELEQQRDRITLYNDVPDRAQLVAILDRTIAQLRLIDEVYVHVDNQNELTEAQDAIADLEEELREAKADLKFAEDKLNAIKELL